jgi:hypothetical protein
LPKWWNGRHYGLKIRCLKRREGSTPSFGTNLARAVLPAPCQKSSAKKIIFSVDIGSDYVMIICMKTEKTIPNLLSTPSKMPCFSFNIPALKFCPAAKIVMNLAKKAKEAMDKIICSSCYACKGFYMMPNVAEALQNKGNFITKSIRENGGDSFVKEMVGQITRKYYKASGEKKSLKNCNTDLFRVHDAGDLFSAKYINCWIRICEALPDIRFWFPTREYVRPDQMPHLQQLALLPNTSVKPSALRLDEPAPQIKGIDAGTAVYTSEEKALEDNHYICPATIHAFRMGRKEWRKVDKKERATLSSCAGNGCKLCFIKGCKKGIAYMAH